jgi:uncharacterized protein (TIGR00369 family)
MKKLVNPWMEAEGYHCFGCDPNHASGLKMEFYEDGDDIVSFWQPTTEFQSWVNILHGGIQATLLDELCGWVIFRKFQTGAVTSKMEIRYRKPVHTNQGELTLRAQAIEERRNLVTVVGRIFDAEGQMCTEATCTYFLFSKERAAAEMGLTACKTEDEI